VPYALRPVPYALRPAPCALCPTPYALNAISTTCIATSINLHL
jgi:hypothetical protein